MSDIPEIEWARGDFKRMLKMSQHPRPVRDARRQLEVRSLNERLQERRKELYAKVKIFQDYVDPRTKNFKRGVVAHLVISEIDVAPLNDQPVYGQVHVWSDMEEMCCFHGLNLESMRKVLAIKKSRLEKAYKENKEGNGYEMSEDLIKLLSWDGVCPKTGNRMKVRFGTLHNINQTPKIINW